jgi:hypothetical protein
MRIGTDHAFDREHFHVTDKGVVLVTADMLARFRGVAPPPLA